MASSEAIVVFMKCLEKAEAETLANYKVEPEVKITGAAFGEHPNSVLGTGRAPEADLRTLLGY